MLSIMVAVLGVTFGARAVEVNVFAAASLTDALKQIAADYQQTSGDKIVFNFAASGPLARQVEAGAPVDIFFSADEARADALAAKGLLVTESRRSLLGNSLVIVTPPENTSLHAPGDLTNAAVQRIALGELKAVPCGIYAKEYLAKIGVWPLVQPKVIPCESVRAVLAAVESGNVDAGIVYKTDAAISKKVKVAFAVPVADGPKITYPLALVKDAPQPDAARKFMNYLAGGQAGAVFTHYGFIVLPATGK
jgi:molybdate transport system substrate-binding protein